MSAFSSLFGKAKVDENVTSLLSKSAGPVLRQDLKARTVVSVPEPASESEESASEAEEVAQEGSESSNDVEEVEVKKPARSRKKKDEHESLEAEYFAKVLKEDKQRNKDEKSEKAEVASEEKEEASDSDESEAEPVKEKRKESKAKSVDLKEQELDKADRTVFVGNVSNKVITSKTTYKEFKKLFRNLGKVESIRFRSIAFDEAVPRKVAFIKRSLHSTRDTINAYVVFKEKTPSLKASARLNATVFDHNHIRVDHVAHPAPKDNKRSIFVGNLDFEETEENVWRYFNSKVDDDVESVRVVRDSKTNLGKGFAIVQFKDTLSVNKALLLNDKPMDKENKKGRKLRILRAKAHTKPSVLSPNHIDNVRKAKKPKTKLTDDQKAKLGRAKALLGKADRSSAGKFVAEGARASKGQLIAGIKGLKSAKGRVKKPRITKRSTQFKNDKAEFAKVGKSGK